MKTFETEKYNIPEGATHYANETNEMHFAWKREDGKYQAPSVSLGWLMFSPIREWIPIPQTKEVEWVNGDMVKYHNKHKGEGGILTFVGIHPTHKDHAVLYGKHLAGEYMSSPLSMLSKPETEVERVERERLENGESYYNKVVAIEREVTGMGADSFHAWGGLSNDYREVYARQAEMFGYGKESE